MHNLILKYKEEPTFTSVSDTATYKRHAEIIITFKLEAESHEKKYSILKRMNCNDYDYPNLKDYLQENEKFSFTQRTDRPDEYFICKRSEYSGSTIQLKIKRDFFNRLRLKITANVNDKVRSIEDEILNPSKLERFLKYG